MKRAILLIISCFLLCGASLSAQDFDAAKRLFDSGKKLSAARAFHRLAENTTDERLLRKYWLAEGECYYALDLTNQLETVIRKLDESFFLEDPADSTDYVLWEAFYKLMGSYHLQMAPVSPYSFFYAEDYFDWADEMLDELTRISQYDNREAKRVLLRERVNLYYLQERYADAWRYSKANLDQLMDSGFDANGPTEAFVDAVSAHALVLARLGRFDEAEEVLSYVSNWNDYPAYLRRIGKIAILRHEAQPESPLDAAPDAYRQYRDRMLADLDRRLPQMSATEREEYWLSLQPFLLDAYRLGNAAPEMLYDLALLSKGYLITYATDKRKVDWKSVRSALNKEECAIEFVEYAGAGEERMMGALVLRKGDKAPRFVELFSVDAFLQQGLYYDYYNEIEITVGMAMQRDNYYMKNCLYSDSDLPGGIWSEELQDAIGDATKVYFSPDGVFQALAIEYMLPESMSGKKAYRLSSTRRLPERNRKRQQRGNALFVGGVDYGTPLNPTHTGNDVATYELFLPNGSEPAEIDSLPGTLSEVNRILSLRAHSLDSLLTGGAATDETFCALVPKGWDIVHVATHGFSAGQYTGEDLSPMYSDPSMSWSGIFFAGAEASVNDPFFDVDYFDGFLSSREIAAQDFSKVNLVVLSACQTALGFVSPEGVFGVQRGLKMAGAHTLALSLWSVDDRMTSELMLRFYRELAADGSSYRDAFDRARQSMVDDAERSLNQPRYFNPATKVIEPQDPDISPEMGEPCYINPFILIDAF